MTVDFRTIVLEKGNDPEHRPEAHVTRRSPAVYVLAVVVAVMSGLCAVAWILG
jgi:hypothetical protein